MPAWYLALSCGSKVPAPGHVEYPAIAQSWRRTREDLSPFFAIGR